LIFHSGNGAARLNTSDNRKLNLSLPAKSQSAGFSLVEIMVGMVMGLLGMIVIFQMLTLFEGQKRTTTGGDDAQNSAAIALHTLQQDIEESGFGVSQMSLLGCNISIAGHTIPLAPVTINPPLSVIPAGDPSTDTLLVFYANSNSISQGNDILAQTSVNQYTMQMPAAFRVNDMVIASPKPCSAGPALIFDRISVAPVVGNVAVTVATGVNNIATATTKGTLYNLGSSPQLLAYAIRGGNLTVCDYFQNDCGSPALLGNATAWLPIANDIVSLRAEYGHDDLATTGFTPMRTQSQIDSIVNATNPPTPVPNYAVNLYNQTTPTTNCGWARTPAVRLALVARGQFEKNPVTPVAPTWAGSAATDWAGSTGNSIAHVSVPIDLSAIATNWSNYRYKVLQTIVPVRNVAWMGVQAGC
jgi:type IV pilus assembly protein PilW